MIKYIITLTSKEGGIINVLKTRNEASVDRIRQYFICWRDNWGPQVPFFLLTIWCITKVSPRFHNWLLSNSLYVKYAKPLVNRLENLKRHPKRAAAKINSK